MNVVKTKLEFSDRLGGCKVRWGMGRMSYIISPGLYAVGSPSDKSPVFVTANFKLSFDHLRSELTGINGWILVLDTKGINVWCAAGKGTFGTDELVHRIRETQLEKVISHRRLILPQLGAPGVAAHRVKEQSGFRVIYGPILAGDIPSFMENKLKATPQMRRVEFPLRQRAALIPIELVMTFKYFLSAAIIILILSGFGPGIFAVDRMISYGSVNLLILLGLYTAGSVLPPLLLPWLPGRSFSAKGGFVGLVLALGLWWHFMQFPGLYRGWPGVTAWLLVIPAVISFLSMNFTGSSTYTSLSGVLKEMRRAMPVQICAAVVGLGFWIGGLFL
ncbi:MAG: acetyl-CoA synthase subunit gamma [FCB group bacterium]|nr:acetyl-CoA synthase subunit gamma [FCB group bacterium]